MGKLQVFAQEALLFSEARRDAQVIKSRWQNCSSLFIDGVAFKYSIRHHFVNSVGATLKAALIDCESWDDETNHEKQLTAYMCFSRAETIEGICVIQRYAPNLFRQGDLPGPNLLLKFWREEIAQTDLEAAFRKQSKKQRKPNNWCWLEQMPLYCRGCSEQVGHDVTKPAKDFPDRGATHLWERVIALGMERFCTACSLSRKKKAGQDFGVQGKDFGVQGRAFTILQGKDVFFLRESVLRRYSGDHASYSRLLLLLEVCAMEEI